MEKEQEYNDKSDWYFTKVISILISAIYIADINDAECISTFELPEFTTMQDFSYPTDISA